MAKYGKNNYFDGVILPEPKEEKLRRMAKGVNCTKGHLRSLDAGLLFDGPRSMECFFNLRQSDGTQRPAQFSTSMIAIAVTPSALFRIGDPLHITKSPIHFCRHFNYALSAEEVAAHYNDGDPAGYVLPSTMKGLTPVEIVGENSHTWTGADDRTYGKLIPISRTLNVGSRYRISVTVSDYEAGSPFINISGTDSASIPSANGTYELELAYTADYPNRIILYGGQSGTDRRLTLIVNSIEPVGCVAEYLPQNLIPTAEGPLSSGSTRRPSFPKRMASSRRWMLRSAGMIWRR